MVDADPGTDGLSLFLLGRQGQKQVSSFGPENTFVGALTSFAGKQHIPFEPRLIHRRGDDHGVTYETIISGKSLYGEEEELTRQLAVPDLDRNSFRSAVRYQFDQLRASGKYSYVLVDTRGGFAVESTDICALADSFIVVTEPDFTSFYQDRNLLKRINHAAGELSSPSVLRAIMVNKATDLLRRDDRPYLDNLEVSFRTELEREFPIRFDGTYAVPADIEALLAYKVQKIPYITAPGCLFSFATLAAFSNILEIVTSQWSKEQVDKWNELVDLVAAASREKEKLEEQKQTERESKERELVELQNRSHASEAMIAALRKEISEHKRSLEGERKRSDALLERLPSAPKADSVEWSTSSNEAKSSGSRGIRNPFIIITALVFCALMLGSAYFIYRHMQNMHATPSSVAQSTISTLNIPPPSNSQNSSQGATTAPPEITNAINQFVQAYNAHDIGQLRTIWPGLTPRQSVALLAFFKEQPSSTVSEQQCYDFARTSDNAAVYTCTETSAFSSGGLPQTHTQAIQFQFGKGNDGWFIESRQ